MSYDDFIVDDPSVLMNESLIVEITLVPGWERAGVQPARARRLPAPVVSGLLYLARTPDPVNVFRNQFRCQRNPTA
jgi:hypothetical protein